MKITIPKTCVPFTFKKKNIYKYCSQRISILSVLFYYSFVKYNFYSNIFQIQVPISEKARTAIFSIKFMTKRVLLRVSTFYTDNFKKWGAIFYYFRKVCSSLKIQFFKNIASRKTYEDAFDLFLKINHNNY